MNIFLPTLAIVPYFLIFELHQCPVAGGTPITREYSEIIKSGFCVLVALCKAVQSSTCDRSHVT